MKLPQTVMKTKLVFGVAITAAVFIVGSIAYAVNSYYQGIAHPESQEQKDKSADDNNSDLPSVRQNTQVEVNNYVGNTQTSKVTASATNIVESTDDTVAPPIQSTKLTVNNHVPDGTPQQQAVQQSPAQPPQPKKSKLLITGSVATVASNDDNKNSITQTNTGIGTGTIDSQMSKQSSPYTLAAGTYIPITMQTGLNSETRGQIVAIVNKDVYDSATGNYLLIPQGARVIGTYDNNVAYGQKRLIAGWNRMIYPDSNGTSVLLRGQPGTSLEGYSGFDGTVNNHYVEIYGSSFIIGGIMGANAAAFGNGSELTSPTTTQTMASMVGGQMAQTGVSVIQKGLNIPPTIIVSAGFRAYIGLTSDLILKPYRRGTRL